MFSTAPKQMLTGQPKKHHKRQKGFTLIELMVVLAVVALAFIYYFQPRANQAKSAGNSFSFGTDMATLNTNISNYYAHNYAGATAANIVNANIVPTNMVDAAGTGLQDAWGGAITFAVVAGNTSYTLTDSTVAQTDCARIASSMYSTVTSLSVNGTPVTSPTTAATACAAASPDVFVYTNG